MKQARNCEKKAGSKPSATSQNKQTKQNQVFPFWWQNSRRSFACGSSLAELELCNSTGLGQKLAGAQGQGGPACHWVA
jgi:hypothetical protein